MNFRYLLLHAGLALFAVLPGISQASVAVPPNFDVSNNIPDPGFPSFWNNATITQTRDLSSNTTLVTASVRPGISSTPGVNMLFHPTANSSYNIGGANFSLTATFDSAGNLVPGDSTVSISGRVLDYTGPGTTPPTGNSVLYFANLSRFGYDQVNEPPGPNQTPAALGFETFYEPGSANNPTGWASQFQLSDESVYLYGFNVRGFISNLTSSDFRSASFNGSAITTVPIPAAVWLFGSAVALLTGVRRKITNT